MESIFINTLNRTYDVHKLTRLSKNIFFIYLSTGTLNDDYALCTFQPKLTPRYRLRYVLLLNIPQYYIQNSLAGS